LIQIDLIDCLCQNNRVELREIAKIWPTKLYIDLCQNNRVELREIAKIWPTKLYIDYRAACQGQQKHNKDVSVLFLFPVTSALFCLWVESQQFARKLQIL